MAVKGLRQNSHLIFVCVVSLLIPFRLQMCVGDRLSDKKTYPTFARTISPYGRIGPPVLRVLEHFNWTWVGIITEESTGWSERGSAIQRFLTENNVTVRIQRSVPSRNTYTANKTGPHMEKVLQDMREVCRGKRECNSLVWRSQIHRLMTHMCHCVNWCQVVRQCHYNIADCKKAWEKTCMGKQTDRQKRGQ